MTHPVKRTGVIDDFYLKCAWCEYEITSQDEPGPAKTAQWYERMAFHIRAKHARAERGRNRRPA